MNARFKERPIEIYKVRIWLAPKKVPAIFIEYGEGSGGEWSAKAGLDPRGLLP